MNKIKWIIFSILTLLFVKLTISSVQAQNILHYSHNFLEPYFNNPSYAGNSGFTSLSLDYRHQWAGIEGSPKTTSLLFQLPFNHKLSMGVNLSNDEDGSLTTIKGLATFGYKIYFGRNPSVRNRLGFGLSVGINRSTLNLNDVSNPSDPAIINLLNNTYSLDGQFGLHYQLGNLELGFALPRLFKTPYTSNEQFNEISFEELGYTFSTIRYRFDLGPSFAFEPWLSYRTSPDFEDQIAGTAVFYYKNILWAGGSYEVNQGLSLFIGFGIGGKIKASYAYEIADQQTPEIGQGTHEFFLALQTGKTNKMAFIEKPVELVSEEVPEKTEEESKEESVQQETEAEPVVEQAVIVEETPEIADSTIYELNDEESEITEPIVEDQPVIEETEPGQLKPGFYVIVGAFNVMENAEQYMSEIIEAGYPAKMEFDQQTSFYYVFISRQDTVERAGEIRDAIRDKDIFNFSEAWILSIE